MSLERRWRPALVLAALTLILTASTTGAALAGGGKTNVCHFQELEGDWKLISIGNPAVAAHLKNHDDALPGGVTSQTLTQLSDQCVPVVTVSCGDCTMIHGTPGCEVEACEDIVCAGDAFCCGTEWDSFCVQDALQNCGSVCVPTSVDDGPGDCCAAHGNPGCDPDSCEDAVCALDPFCCSSPWDETCAEEAATVCPSQCGS